MKPRSPVLGYNHNVRYAARLWHVQTEDSGVQAPHIFTHLFHDGTIVASKKTQYDPQSEVAVVQKLMQVQHKSMLRELKDGAFDGKIEKLYGPIVGKAPEEAGEIIEMIAETTGEIMMPPLREQDVPDAPPAAPPRAAPPAAAPLAAAPPRAAAPAPAAPPRAAAPPVAAPRPPSLPQAVPPAPAPPARSAPPPPRAAQLADRPTERDLGAVVSSVVRPVGARAPGAPPETAGAEEPRKKRPTLNPARPSVAVPTRPASGTYASPPPTIGSSRAAASQSSGAQSSSTVPRTPPPTIGSSRSGSGGSASRIPAEGVVVARPAVIVGKENAQTRGAADFWKTEQRAPEPAFGENLISEKSLDEVILAYLSEDAPKK